LLPHPARDPDRDVGFQGDDQRIGGPDVEADFRGFLSASLQDESGAEDTTHDRRDDHPVHLDVEARHDVADHVVGQRTLGLFAANLPHQRLGLIPSNEDHERFVIRPKHHRGAVPKRQHAVNNGG